MTAVPPTTATVWRFRRLAVLYPTAWLVQHGEAYVGTMLDVADAEGRDRPSRRDRLSTLRHLGGVWSAELRRRARADRGLRSFGVVGHAALLSGATLALLCLVLAEWAPGWLVPGGPPEWWDHRVTTWTTGALLFPLWLAALGLVAAGRPVAARRLLRVLVLLPAGLVAVHVAGGPDRPSAGVLVALTVFAVPASWIPAVGPRGRVALVVVPVAGTVAAGAWVLSLWTASPFRSVDDPPLGAGFYRADGLAVLAVPVFWLVVAAAAVAVLLAVVRPGALLAVGVVGTGWLWLALSTRMHVRADELLARGTVALGITAVPGMVVVLLALGLGARRLVATR